MYRNRTAFLSTACVVFLLAACSGDGSGGFFYEVNVQTPEAIPIEVASSTACALDLDCSEGLFCFQGRCARECGDEISCKSGLSCSNRGRCLAADSSSVASALSPDDGSLVDNALGVKLTSKPQRTQQVPSGVNKIEVVVDTSSVPSGGTLAYRVERTDDEGDPNLVLHSTGSTSFKLEILAGQASPDVEKPSAVDIYVVTAAGAFRLTLIPQLPVSGTYTGYAYMNLFGQTGLPIDFQVVTNPPDASLESATEAWVVMPVGKEKLFSPHEPLADAGDEQFMTRSLTKDAFTGMWVATFVNEYRLGSGSMMAAGNILGQVRRTIRLELEVDAGNDNLLTGSISDRWTGLYDHRPDFGDRIPANIVFEGALEMYRVGGASDYTDVTPPKELGQGNPGPLPLPELDECQDTHLVVQADGEFNCDGLTTIEEFGLASPEEQVGCAVAVARAAMSGKTTAMEIQAFLDNSNTGEMSFAEFMGKCAAGTDGLCRPSSEILCSRQLVAHAYASLDGSVPGVDELFAVYLDATREAFLGRQLGAFQTDAQTRLDWLKSSDYPAIVTSAVKDLISGLLDSWAENVLDVHLSVLSGQVDASVLAILSQSAENEDEAAQRQKFLMEVSQSWRGAADALELAATRWDQLFQDAKSRTQKANFVSQRMFDLYLAAGMLTKLNQANNAEAASAGFAGGFGSLAGALGDLALPFDRLIYARDAEVVVSTSVDPLSNNSTLLSERKAAALKELESASTAVGKIIADSQAEALNQAMLTNEMNNVINDLRTSLVELCGLPVGCSTDSFRTDPTCNVRVAPGQCGFLIEHETNDYLAFGPEQQSVSEAGTALLSIQSASLAYEQVEEEMRAHTTKTNLELATTTAFARMVEDSHAIRTRLIADVSKALAARNVARTGELAALMDNIEARQTRREAEMAKWTSDLNAWDKVLIDGVEQDFQNLAKASSMRSVASTFRDAATKVDGISESTRDGIPKSVGTSNDVAAPSRMSIGLVYVAVAAGLRVSASLLDSQAKNLEVQVAKDRAMAEVKQTSFDLHRDLDNAVMESDITKLVEEAELAGKRSEIEEVQLRELIGNLERVAEAELAHKKDLTELSDRQTAVKKMLADAAGLELKLLQAEMTLTAAVQNYLTVAQRASLQAARIEDLERQRSQINSLVGSPSAVFAWANRLELAEGRLIRAKDKLMDWLVALEYLAVRPFIDQRVQILLARNTYQLEDIAAEIDRLQGVCGGPISKHISDLSLRDDLLDLSHSIQDPITGRVVEPAQRFRELLDRGAVPIDKRIRYTADSTIGGLLANRKVMAATVTVSLDNFANLAASCNSKAYAIAVQMVGEGLANVQPTVTVLYDGASELQSCQPGLEEYLDTVGRESTAYGAVTRLNTSGRSVSPVAGVNQYPEDNVGNLSLAGLPLASEYTIMIDPEIGENPKIDWSKLEDIRLRIEYTYQDFFPKGTCN